MVPATIESVQTEGGAFNVREGGRIIDSKSALKPFRGIAHDHRLQLTSYVMITPAASGPAGWTP
jgi:hypothetical protein